MSNKSIKDRLVFTIQDTWEHAKSGYGEMERALRFYFFSGEKKEWPKRCMLCGLIEIPYNFTVMLRIGLTTLYKGETAEGHKFLEICPFHSSDLSEAFDIHTGKECELQPNKTKWAVRCYNGKYWVLVVLRFVMIFIRNQILYRPISFCAKVLYGMVDYLRVLAEWIIWY